MRIPAISSGNARFVPTSSHRSHGSVSTAAATAAQLATPTITISFLMDFSFCTCAFDVL